jgi:hypothetical protein
LSPDPLEPPSPLESPWLSWLDPPSPWSFSDDPPPDEPVESPWSFWSP